jgi:hypothetical protein
MWEYFRFPISRPLYVACFTIEILAAGNRVINRRKNRGNTDTPLSVCACCQHGNHLRGGVQTYPHPSPYDIGRRITRKHAPAAIPHRGGIILFSRHIACPFRMF